MSQADDEQRPAESDGTPAPTPTPESDAEPGPIPEAEAESGTGSTPDLGLEPAERRPTQLHTDLGWAYLLPSLATLAFEFVRVTNDVALNPVSFGIGVVFGLVGLWLVTTPLVVMKEQGLRFMTRGFGWRELRWDEIRKVKTNRTGATLSLENGSEVMLWFPALSSGSVLLLRRKMEWWHPPLFMDPQLAALEAAAAAATGRRGTNPPG